IRNRFVDGSSGRQFEKRSPVDGSLVGMVPEAGAAGVNSAVGAAQGALLGARRRVTLTQRGALVEAVAAEIDRRADDFIDAEVQDTGKPRALASHLDIPRGAANFRVFADVVKNVATECFEMPTPDGRTALNYSIRVPRGVIAVICP